jgi:hypothetical protein
MTLLTSYRVGIEHDAAEITGVDAEILVDPGNS